MGWRHAVKAERKIPDRTGDRAEGIESVQLHCEKGSFKRDNRSWFHNTLRRRREFRRTYRRPAKRTWKNRRGNCETREQWRVELLAQTQFQPDDVRRAIRQLSNDKVSESLREERQTTFCSTLHWSSY